jgi:hypothetical protein
MEERRSGDGEGEAATGSRLDFSLEFIGLRFF